MVSGSLRADRDVVGSLASALLTIFRMRSLRITA